MKQHLRMDGIKVFEEEEKIIESIMQTNNIKKKSDAWRFALKFWMNNKDLSSSVDTLSTRMSKLEGNVSEKLDDLYFKIDVIAKK
jgi:hypothetical protein